MVSIDRPLDVTPADEVIGGGSFVRQSYIWGCCRARVGSHSAQLNCGACNEQGPCCRSIARDDEVVGVWLRRHEQVPLDSRNLGI